MIIGDCPYEDCDGHHALPVPKKTPAFGKEECEACHRPFWLKYSRIDPEGWTEEEFLQKFEINEETKSIKEKSP